MTSIPNKVQKGDEELNDRELEENCKNLKRMNIIQMKAKRLNLHIQNLFHFVYINSCYGIKLRKSCVQSSSQISRHHF